MDPKTSEVCGEKELKMKKGKKKVHHEKLGGCTNHGRVQKKSGNEDNEHPWETNHVAGYRDLFIWVSIWSGGKRKC